MLITLDILLFCLISVTQIFKQDQSGPVKLSKKAKKACNLREKKKKHLGDPVPALYMCQLTLLANYLEIFTVLYNSA